jgi:microcystin-dependent protein
MANYEATKYDFSGASLTGIEGVNTGLIVPWGNNSTPSGFLDCDGTAVNRTTYANLFAIIGTTYGVGDGSTTFNVPDLTDRVVVGKSPGKALASTGGANTVDTSGNITGGVGNTTLDTSTIASHTHSMKLSNAGGTNSKDGPEAGAANQVVQRSSANTGGGGAHTHSFGGSFAGSAVSVLQPFAVVKYIIKT